jgi:hypothetical protein
MRRLTTIGPGVAETKRCTVWPTLQWNETAPPVRLPLRVRMYRPSRLTSTHTHELASPCSRQLRALSLRCRWHTLSRTGSLIASMHRRPVKDRRPEIQIFNTGTSAHCAAVAVGVRQDDQLLEMTRVFQRPISLLFCLRWSCAESFHEPDMRYIFWLTYLATAATASDATTNNRWV